MGLFLVNGVPVDLPDGVAAQLGYARAPAPVGPSVLAARRGTSTRVNDPCVLAQSAAASGADPAIVASLRAKCAAQRSATAAGPDVTGYPEPSEGIPPAVIAAGVVAAAVVGFVAFKKLHR